MQFTLVFAPFTNYLPTYLFTFFFISLPFLLTFLLINNLIFLLSILHFHYNRKVFALIIMHSKTYFTTFVEKFYVETGVYI